MTAIHYSLLLGAFFCLPLGAYSQKNTDKSLWPSNAIHIDGLDSEWPHPLTHTDKGTGMQYSAVNDGQKLYFCFQCSNPATQIKMIRSGMTITLSTGGDKKRKSEINFPLEELGDPGPGSGASHQRGDMKQLHNRFLAGSTMMGISGFEGRKDGMVSIHDSLGMNAAINWDTANVMTYELSIPFSALWGAGFTKQDLTQKITLNVEIRPLDHPGQNRGFGDDDDSGNRMEHRNGGYGGGMGGGHGGGHHGSYGGAQSGHDSMDRNALFEASRFEWKFLLALAPQ